jgi:DNA-binding transcriptional regulator YiaG
MTPQELRAFLVEHELSQLALARLLGVNPRTVRRWVEGGREQIPPAAVMRIKIAKMTKKIRIRRETMTPENFRGPGS